MTRRKPKKTESLEVRLPHEVKRAFMDRARSRGRTASSLVRDFIDSYLAGTNPRTENRTMLKRIATPAAVTSVIASAIALHVVTPTAASAQPDFKSVFNQLDVDKDGKLSPEEMSGNAPLASEPYAHHSADMGQGAIPLIVAAHSGMARIFHGSGSPQGQADMHKSFAALDSDGNGAVTFGEFEAHHLEMVRHVFDTIDASQDGTIERSELSAAMEHIPAGVSALASVPSFERLDADSNGAISWAEFLG